MDNTYNTKVLATFNVPSEAYLVKNYLESNDIKSEVMGEYLANTHIFYSIADGGVKLIVLESDYPEARELYDSLLNRNNEDNVCPKCQSKNCERFQSPKKSFFNQLKIFASIMILGSWDGRKTNYKCLECGYTFDVIPE